LDGNVSTSNENISSEDDQEVVQRVFEVPPKGPVYVPSFLVLGVLLHGPVKAERARSTTHAEVCDTPEDEPEPSVEETGHERQHVGKEGDDFGDYEGCNPEDGEDGTPSCPTGDGIRVAMMRIGEYLEKYEASGDRAIESTEEDNGGYGEGECNLLENRLQRAKRRCGHILGANKVIHNSAAKSENDDF